MDLFSDIKSDPIQLLPRNGNASYYGSILDMDLAHEYYKSLLENLAWKADEAIIYGKHIITKRQTAWYGDKIYTYTYSGITRSSLPWTAELLELKARIESITQTSYNSCLCNLYPSGNEGVAWHSDDEKELNHQQSIASLSLGAESIFKFKHKLSGEIVSIALPSGSLLEMKDETQAYWVHEIPKTKKIIGPRINLTFRVMN